MVERKIRYDEDALIKFDVVNQHNIEHSAKGLSAKEALSLWGYEDEELNDNDKRFFYHHFRKGRSRAKEEAIDALFVNMKQKGGGQVALSYLARFADEFEEEKAADGELKSKKSFTITFDKGE